MSNTHFTMVFQVEDQNTFSKFLEKFTKAFAEEKPIEGAKITGCGWEDSMSRADHLVELCEENYIPIPSELM